MKLSKIFPSYLVLVTIMVYGFFRNWILEIYAKLTMSIFSTFISENHPYINLLKNQALTEDRREQTLGWFLYYPSYFFLHILFIYLLFSNNIKIRNLVIIGLSLFVFILVFGSFFFTYIGYEEVGYFFRMQFKKIFGLPFILLSIEGGRILYFDVLKILNKSNKNSEDL